MKLGLQLIDLTRQTSILEHYDWLCSFSGTGTDLARMQTERLSRLLLAIRQTNSFYGPLLEKTDKALIETDPRSVLAILPIMDKAFVQSHSTQLFAKQLGRSEKMKKTGGSTGKPLKYCLDAESISLTWGYALYCWHMFAGYSPGDPYVTIAGQSLRSVHNSVMESVYQSLHNNHLIPAESIVSRMKLNKRRLGKAKLLFAYPTVLHQLIIHNPQFPSYLHSIQAVFTTSEQLQPSVRQAIEKAFNVNVFDMYGANDGGLVSCEDNSHNGFLYHPLNCMIEEYLNENGHKELLLTSLNSWTFPLVRYRVGDIADAEQPGQNKQSTFPRVYNLKGRTRDLVRLPSGRIIHGSSFNAVFYSFTKVIRYRIIQQKDYRLCIKVQLRDSNKSLPMGILEKLHEVIKDETHFDIEIVDQFPVSDRKFKVIDSHVT